MIKRNKTTIDFIADYLKQNPQFSDYTPEDMTSFLKKMNISDFREMYRDAQKYGLQSSEKQQEFDLPVEPVKNKSKFKKTLMKSYTFQMPPELLDRLQSLSDHNMTSVSNEIRQAILERLESRGY